MNDSIGIPVRPPSATLVEEQSTPFMNTRVSVRPGVYFAPVQGEGVVLNLPDDCYYGLNGQSAAIWRAVLEPPPAAQAGRGNSSSQPQWSSSIACDSDLIQRQLKAWADAGLVTSGVAGADHLPNPRPAGTPATVALDASTIRATACSWSTAFRFLHAVWWTRRSLERRGLCATLKHLEQMPVSAPRPAEHVEDAAYRVARVYYTLRRISSQGRDDCLLRSLALVKVLRRIGVNAEICFGVQKFPFIAHTWVEVSGTLVNETPRMVQSHTILARF